MITIMIIQIFNDIWNWRDDDRGETVSDPEASREKRQNSSLSYVDALTEMCLNVRQQRSD